MWDVELSIILSFDHVFSYHDSWLCNNIELYVFIDAEIG
jgi:hypothetical protein